ncbi:hypothetical protein JCM21900_004744 [Sporobolomyces salmonicolor]
MSSSPASASRPFLPLHPSAPLERFDSDALFEEHDAGVAADQEKLSAILEDFNALYQDVVSRAIRAVADINTEYRELIERSFEDISHREQCRALASAVAKRKLSACLDTIAGALSSLFGFVPSHSAAHHSPAIAPLVLVDPKEPVERFDVEGARLARQAAEAEDDEKLSGALPSSCPPSRSLYVFRQIKELFADIAVGVTVHLTAMDTLCADHLHETAGALRASEEANERNRQALATFFSRIKVAVDALAAAPTAR